MAARWLLERLAASALKAAEAAPEVVHKPKTVANVVANASRSADRHTKTEARKAYMRDLMRRKRAATKLV